MRISKRLASMFMSQKISIVNIVKHQWMYLLRLLLFLVEIMDVLLLNFIRVITHWSHTVEKVSCYFLLWIMIHYYTLIILFVKCQVFIQHFHTIKHTFIVRFSHTHSSACYFTFEFSLWTQFVSIAYYKLLIYLKKQK